MKKKYIATITALVSAISAVCVALIGKIETIKINVNSSTFHIIIYSILSIIALISVLYAIFSKKVKCDLYNHPVFSMLKFWKHYLKYSFKLNNLGREIIFKEILIQKYVVREKNLYELIKETNNIKNITKFKAIHLKYLYKGVDDYIKNLLESKIYSDDDRVIMKIVLNKFSEWQMPRIEILANEINDICDSRVFSGPKQLNAAILTIYESFLAATITDAAKTLDYLNGELTGKKFRGKEI